ncbi:Calcium permeable stress-gated cation channel 1 [Smittium mucronatum]|uniref:Calcium permeable stress-gated cation channel 1 n=1 Tax=Smittium mucronatum TaxID=133383 RepID=A0A1R0GSS2_9FUNG|nr:Calcium permeable stress-gated cation channel 1 [Smittium mucronatum]
MIIRHQIILLLILIIWIIFFDPNAEGQSVNGPVTETEESGIQPLGRNINESVDKKLDSVSQNTLINSRNKTLFSGFYKVSRIQNFTPNLKIKEGNLAPDTQPASENATDSIQLAKAKTSANLQSEFDALNSLDKSEIKPLSKRENISNFFDPSYITALTKNGASTSFNFWIQFVVGLVFGILLVIIFSFLRLKFKFIFSPRTRLKLTSPPKLPNTLFGWIIPTLRTSDVHVLNSLGLDAYIFLRFHKLLLRMLLDIGIVAMIIIYPLNIKYASQDLDDFLSNNNATNSTDTITVVKSMSSVKSLTLLFNSTKAVNYSENKSLILIHIVFAYVFSIIAFYHLTKFTSQWASLRWHFLMCARNSIVSRTVMISKIPKFLVDKPASLKWLWEDGVGAGKVESIRVCPDDTDFLDVIKKRAQVLSKLENEYQRILGNPCLHPDYNPSELFHVIMTEGSEARIKENELLTKWAQPHLLSVKKISSSKKKSNSSLTQRICFPSGGQSTEDDAMNPQYELENNPVLLKRSKILIRDKSHGKKFKFKRVDKIDYLRSEFIRLDEESIKFRDRFDEPIPSSTAFITFEDAATAHMVCQMSMYPNPSKMVAKMAPEPRGVYWKNMNFSAKKKQYRKYIMVLMLITLSVLWVPPVISLGSLLSPATLSKIGFLNDIFNKYPFLRGLAYSTLPSLVLVSFFNILPWMLKHIVFYGGARSLQEMDFSVLCKTWLFLVYNVIFVLCVSGAIWDVIVKALDDPRSLLQKLADIMPGLGSFFISYVFLLGVTFQPLKLLQLRPVVWYLLRRYLCHSPREFAKLAAPVYIDWYNVYPYPMLVFTISIFYSTFSPLVVWMAILYYAIGYVVMKYLLLYVYFRNYESGAMMWPKILTRMTISVIMFQIIISFFAVTKTTGYWGLLMIPLIIGSFMYLFIYVNKVTANFEFIPMYLWKHPPPSNSYPKPPPSSSDGWGTSSSNSSRTFGKKSDDTLQKFNSFQSFNPNNPRIPILGMDGINLPKTSEYQPSGINYAYSQSGLYPEIEKDGQIRREKRSKLFHVRSDSPVNFLERYFDQIDPKKNTESRDRVNAFFFTQKLNRNFDNLFKENLDYERSIGYTGYSHLDKKPLNVYTSLADIAKQGSVKLAKGVAKKLSGVHKYKKDLNNSFSNPSNEKPGGVLVSKNANTNKHKEILKSLDRNNKNLYVIQSSSPDLFNISRDNQLNREYTLNSGYLHPNEHRNSKIVNSASLGNFPKFTNLRENVDSPRFGLKRDYYKSKLTGRVRSIRSGNKFNTKMRSRKVLNNSDYIEYIKLVSQFNSDQIKDKDNNVSIGTIKPRDKNDLHGEEIKKIENMILTEEGGGPNSKTASSYSLAKDLKNEKKSKQEIVKSSGLNGSMNHLQTSNGLVVSNSKKDSAWKSLRMFFSNKGSVENNNFEKLTSISSLSDSLGPVKYPENNGLGIKLVGGNSCNSLTSISNYTNSTDSLNYSGNMFRDNEIIRKYYQQEYKRRGLVSPEMLEYYDYFGTPNSFDDFSVINLKHPESARIKPDFRFSLPVLLDTNQRPVFDNRHSLGNGHYNLQLTRYDSSSFERRVSELMVASSSENDSRSAALSIYGDHVVASDAVDSQETKVNRNNSLRTGSSDTSGTISGDQKGDSMDPNDAELTLVGKIKTIFEKVHDSTSDFFFSDFNPASSILDGSIDILFSNTAEQKVDYNLEFSKLGNDDENCGLDVNYDDLSLSYFGNGDKNRSTGIGNNIGRMVKKILKRKRISHENILASTGPTVSNGVEYNQVPGTENKGEVSALGHDNNQTIGHEKSIANGHGDIEGNRSVRSSQSQIIIEIKGNSGIGSSDQDMHNSNDKLSGGTPVSTKSNELVGSAIRSQKTEVTIGKGLGPYKYEFGQTLAEKRSKIAALKNGHDQNSSFEGKSGNKSSDHKIQPLGNYSISPSIRSGNSGDNSSKSANSKRSPINKNSNYDYFNKNVNLKRMTKYPLSLYSMFNVEESGPNDGEDLKLIKSKGSGITGGSTNNEDQYRRYSANYQKFAAEAQHELLPSKHSDYKEPPMLRVPGILDGSVMDYVHPGLYGTLPELWLPVKSKHDDSLQ